MSEFDRLEVKVQASAKKANTELDSLADKLNRVSSALSGVQSGGLLQLSNGVNHLATSMKNLSSVRATDYTRLATGLQKLGNIDSQSMYRASNALRNISNSLSGMSATVPKSVSDIANLAQGISKLGYKSTTNAISNIPKLATAMNNLITTLSKSPTVSKNVIELTNSLANLASQGKKVSSASRAVTNATNHSSKAMKNYGNSTRSAISNTTSLRSEIMRLYAALLALRGIANTVWNSVKKSMDYTETVNLFQTAYKKIGTKAAENAGYDMGTTAGENFARGFVYEAQEFNDYISNALSLNPDTMMNYQAIFGQISNALGETTETSMNLSKSLTMLGTDLASLFNIDISTAMDKLQQGLVGQVKGLRTLGIDITEATLQTYAYKYGIEDSVDSMSQAAKVQLRYLAIMDQSSVAFGDMAKTISSPANQLRILKQNWDNLCRSIGNVFMPLIQNVLPYLNGLLIAIRNITDAFAKLTGYETPDYSDTNTNAYSDVTNNLLDVDGAIAGTEGIADGLGNVSDSAKDAEKSVSKLNKALSKFDELNDIGRTNSQSKGNGGSSGASSGISIGGGGYSQLDDAIGKSTAGYLEAFNEQLSKSQNKAKEFAEKVQPKIQKVIDVIKKIAPVVEDAFIGITVAFATYKIATLFTELGTTLINFATSPLGATVLIIGALASIAWAIKDCWERAKEKDLAKRFGKITASAEELEKMARQIVDNGSLDGLAQALSQFEKADSIADDIKEVVTQLKKLNMKVELGLELTLDEQEQYKQAIDKYIELSEQYIDEEQLAVIMGINLLVSDEKSKQELISGTTQYFNENKAALEEEARKLSDAVTAAFSDGLLTPDEATVIQGYQIEMAKIQAKIAADDFAVKMKTIELSYSATDMDADTAKKLMEEAQNAVDEATKGFNEVTARVLVSLEDQESTAKEKIAVRFEAGEISYDEYLKQIDKATKEFSNKKKDAKLGKLENIGELQLRASKVSLNTFVDAFGEEIDTVTPEIESKMKELYENAFYTDTDGNVYFDYDDFDLELRRFNDHMISTTKETRGAMNDWATDTLSPNNESLIKQAKEWVAAGEKIPENIAKGIVSDVYLQAISGNVGAVYALMAGQLTDSEERTHMLGMAKRNGYDVDFEVYNSIIDNGYFATDGIKEVVASVGTEITTSTDGILPSVGKAGKSINERFGKGIENEKSNELAAKHMVEEAQKAAEYEEYYNQFKKDGKKVNQKYGSGIETEDDAELAAKHMVEEAEKEASAEKYYSKFKSSGKKVDTKYASGIDANGAKVTTASKNMVGKAKTEAGKQSHYDKVSGYGEKFAKSYATGITNREWEAEQAAKHMVEEAQKQADYEAWQKGNNVSKGYANGINSGTKNVSKATSKMADAANSTFQKKMDIHSPSKLYEKFANFTTEGYNGQIIRNIGKTKQTIGRWADSIREAGSKISINPLNFKSNYTVNTNGIEGYSDLFSDSTVTMKAMESVNIDQTSNSLNELPSLVEQAILRGIERARITATVDGNDVFNSTKQKAKEYYNQTGGLAPFPV